MNTAVDQVEAQALALNDTERANLAERLVESLAQPVNGSAQAAWISLARQRRDEIRTGAVIGIPGEEGSAMVRKLVGR